MNVDEKWLILKDCSYKIANEELNKKVLNAFLKPFIGDVSFDDKEEINQLKSFVREHYFFMEIKLNTIICQGIISFI